MSDTETEQATLSLSFFIETPKTENEAWEPAKLDAEVCLTCLDRLKNAIESAEALTIHQAAPQRQDRLADASLKAFENAFSERSQNATSPVGPTEEQKVGRKPTEELLEDEIHAVPSSVDLRKGSNDVRALNREIVKQKGTCPHHYKTFEEGAIKCADAPPGIRGPYANFKGCGKTLGDNEL
jgi:hypothetical protein